MRTALVVLMLGVLAACEGRQGPAGVPSGREGLYCRHVNVAREGTTLTFPGPGSFGTYLACDDKRDIPWEGACSASGLPADFFLAVDGPVGWTDGAVVPGWQCIWKWRGDAPSVQSFAVDAVLCCIAVGHEGCAPLGGEPCGGVGQQPCAGSDYGERSCRAL